jgi:hypothetical protein
MNQPFDDQDDAENQDVEMERESGLPAPPVTAPTAAAAQAASSIPIAVDPPSPPSNNAPIDPDDLPAHDDHTGILPSGATRRFITGFQSGAPGPPGPHRAATRVEQLISRTNPEPESIWTPIGPTPFHDRQYHAWREYRRNPKRPPPSLTQFAEHYRILEHEVSTQI